MLPLELNDSVDVRGKRVFVRVDFNAPIQQKEVQNGFRIFAALKTITWLKERGAKIILGSHVEGAEGGDIAPISLFLKKHVSHVCVPSTDLVVISEHIAKMNEGDVMLLSNLRFWRGEEAEEERFAKNMTALADIYVNEAFSVSHRSHASITLFPKFLPSFAGFNFTKEIQELSRAFQPVQPFLFILGGAKFETKEPLISKFLNSAATVFIGGALANDFYRARGLTVGVSRLSEPLPEIPEGVLNSSRLLLPIDVTVKAADGTVSIKKPEEVSALEKIVDAGPETLQMLKSLVEKAKLILWNGPLGIYEEGFTALTEELAIAIAESEALSIVGGGDTVAAISRLQLENTFDFVSTGGGAMLEFLQRETLPGIEALQTKNTP